MTISPFKKISLYIGILSHLLYSFYFYSIGVAPFAIMSAIILSYFCFSSFSKTRYYFDLAYKQLFILIIFLMISFIWSICVCYFENQQFYPQSFVGMLLNLGILFGFIGLAATKEMQANTFNAIALFFVISLIIFFIQAIAWYIFDVELDFLLSITGEEQRLMGHQMSVNGVVTRRVSGIFSEPALYSWVMIGIGYYLLDSLQKLKYKLPAQFAYIFSILASYSLSGWVLTIGSEILKFIRSGKSRTLAYLVATIGIFILLLYPFIEAYWQARVLLIDDDGSYEDKISSLKVILKYLSDFYYLIIGIGVATKIDTPALGFLTSSLLLFGVFGTILMYGFIISTVFNLPGNKVDKVFIIIYVPILGNYVTSTINWFVLGSMIFLMIRNFSTKSIS